MSFNDMVKGQRNKNVKKFFDPEMYSIFERISSLSSEIMALLYDVKEIADDRCDWADHPQLPERTENMIEHMREFVGLYTSAEDYVRHG